MSHAMTTSRSPATRRRTSQPDRSPFPERSVQAARAAPQHDTPLSSPAFPIDKLDLATLAIQCVPLGHDDEDDVTTGAAYLHLHSKWRQLQEAIDKRAYLKQVRRNLCATERRASLRELEISQSRFETQQHNASESPDQALAARELSTRLEEALRQFDHDGLIVQFVLENKTYDQIAQLHGISSGAVRGRMRRAISNIRRSFSSDPRL